MNFKYSHEQEMLQDSVLKLLDSYANDDTGGGTERIWRAFAQMGLLALNVGEADGGLAMGSVENLIVMRAMGRKLCSAPYLASALYGTTLLNVAASSIQRTRIAPALLDGSCRLAVAHEERQSRYRAAHIVARAVEGKDGFVLSGRKILVLGGSAATHLIVSARLSGDIGSGHGIGLFLVPRDTAGVGITQRRTIDGRTADDVDLVEVCVPTESLLAARDGAIEALNWAFDHAAVGCMNEAVGAMEELLAMTVDYLKTRRQFGAAIGTFQALQHRAVDMFVEVEQAKSMALYATMQLGAATPERRNALALSKLLVNRAARGVGEAAVQLHGAIGMTMESTAGRLFNRLAASQVMFGDSDFWLSLAVEEAPDILAA